MKAHKILIPILTGVLFAAAANAQEDITITGSTAARRIVYDRAATLFDPGYTTRGGVLSYTNSGNLITVQGTMSGAIPSLGSAVVTIRFGMSGSNQGAQDVNNQNPIGTLDPVTGNVSNAVPLITFMDNFPAACIPVIPDSAFTANTNLMVLPFVLVKNIGANDMATVTNFTHEQAVMLLSSSGIIAGLPAMTPSFLGATTANAVPVFLMGRDSGSGTRIGILHDTGFTGIPRQYGTNGSGQIVNSTTIAGSFGITAADNGYNSGGTLMKVVSSVNLTGSNIISYAGEPDASSGNGVTTNNWLSYEGIFPTHTDVANGRYPIWCYEHIFAKASTLSANQTAIMNAFVASLSDPTYQTTNTTVFRANAVALSEMKVKRGVDGGSFTTTPAAGF